MFNGPRNLADKLGIEHTGSIDLVTSDPAAGVYRLVVIEPGPWDGSHIRLRRLQDKLNTYIAFIVDGDLEKRYPDAEGKRVVIRLDLYCEPDEKTRAVMNQLGKAIEEEGLGFEIFVDSRPAP